MQSQASQNLPSTQRLHVTESVQIPGSRGHNNLSSTLCMSGQDVQSGKCHRTTLTWCTGGDIISPWERNPGHAAWLLESPDAACQMSCLSRTSTAQLVKLPQLTPPSLRKRVAPLASPAARVTRRGPAAACELAGIRPCFGEIACHSVRSFSSGRF